MSEKEDNRIILLLTGFMKRTEQDHIGAYAAQAAYFLIMSFIPFVLFLSTLVRYTPLTYATVRRAIMGFVPVNLQEFVLGIVAQVYYKNAAVVPITAFMALWSSGKGMQALMNGLNTIYHVRETRNWLVNRIYSVFYTFLFVLALIASLLLLVMGNVIQASIARYVPFLGEVIGRIISARTFLVFVVLFFIFLVLYKAIPNRKATLKSQVPGALLTAIAWSLFSYFFSLYFAFFPNFSNMYGNMTAIIMVMLWLYFCMNLLLYGAEVNAYFEKEFRKAQESVREMLSREKEQAEKAAREKEENQEKKCS